MLSRVIFVKIDTRRVFALHVSSTRPLSSLFKHPEFQCTSLLQQPVYSQGKCYHNAEAESTGARRQQHLIEQQSKAKFQPLKSASGTNNNKRFLIPSMTTHQRHLGPHQSPLTGPKPTVAPASTDSVDIIRTYATDFVKEKLIEQIAKPATKSKRKVTVVGSGQVGIATVISILAQNVSNEVCIIDANEKLVNAEAKDIQHGSLFLRDAKVIASKDYEGSKDSAVRIVTAGARQKEGQTRLDLLKTNVDILSQIVPQLVKYSPKTVIVIITNPCDVLTYAAWKLSGLPVERVFATGTHLDTSRFRYFIAQRLGVSASSVQGYIIGEHGDSSVPVWSGVSVGGVRFSDLNKCIGSEGDTDGWNEIHKQVVKAAYEVIAGKGYTNWAIGLTAASVASMILDNKNEVATVSTLAKDHQCIEQDVFLSLPVVIGANGITSFVNLQLSEMEQKNLCKSAEILDKATKSISEKSAENKKKK